MLKDRNIAETNPTKFAAMLIEKLEALKTKQEEPERMREFINTLEVSCQIGNRLDVHSFIADDSSSYIAGRLATV